ncbi:MAG: hydrogenase nickel incorporation protein HypB [Candidatus Margulisiibacteriota bacterium]
MEIKLNDPILTENNTEAQKVREKLKKLNLFAINMMASPGAGKTSLIIALLKSLPKELKAGVIEGDVASSVDTDKIISLGWPAFQINTSGGCHLTASMINKAIDQLGISGPGILFIENIGNLICPTEFDLGENIRIVLSSVPEGDDKPVKYPGIYQKAHAIVLNKIDYMIHSDFDLASFIKGTKLTNETAPLFKVSSKTGEGIKELSNWIVSNML